MSTRDNGSLHLVLKSAEKVSQSKLVQPQSMDSVESESTDPDKHLNLTESSQAHGNMSHLEMVICRTR